MGVFLSILIWIFAALGGACIIVLLSILLCCSIGLLKTIVRALKEGYDFEWDNDDD